MTAPRPNIKARKGVLGQNATQKPHCPYHGTEMVFDTGRLCWVCTSDNCGMVSWPKAEVEDGKPIIGKGDVEVVQAGTHTFIRAGNVMIDVTDAHSTTRKLKGGYVVELIIKSAIKFDGVEGVDLE